MDTSVNVDTSSRTAHDPATAPGRFVVRDAHREDLPEAVGVQVVCFREIGQGVIPKDILSEVTGPGIVHTTVEQWQQFMDEGAIFKILVDRLDMKIVGVAMVRTSTSPDAPTPWEVATLHVLPEARSCGASDEIRQAAVGDGQAVAACMRTCWEESFLSYSPWCLTWFDSHRSDLGPTLDDRMSHGEYVWLAVDTESTTDGLLDLVGFAWAGVHLDAPTPLELESLYVRSRLHGTGLGQALMKTAIGDSPAYVMVYPDNARAKAFYRRNGFSPDGYLDDHRDEDPAYVLERWIR